jgi:hypothetical protein
MDFPLPMKNPKIKHCKRMINTEAKSPQSMWNPKEKRWAWARIRVTRYNNITVTLTLAKTLGMGHLLLGIFPAFFGLFSTRPPILTLKAPKSFK